MSNLLKYTVPTWNDHVYDYNNDTLDIKTCDSVIRIFGMLDRGSDNEDLMARILRDSSVTISMPDLLRFEGSDIGDSLDLNLAYDAWTHMEAQNNAPHIVLGTYSHQTYCAWIDSWTNPNTMTLSRINPDIAKNRLGYLTNTRPTSSLLALPMLNNLVHGWMWKDNTEYSSLNIHIANVLATYRYNLNPVPVNNQGNLFNNWTMGSILISLNSLPSYNLFDAQVYDPVLSSTGLNWVERTSSTGETCTLATDLSSETMECAIVGSSVIWYKTAPYHPVSKMMDTNYKGVYTTSKKDTVFINGGSYKPTSLLKYTNRLLRKN